MCVGGSWPVTRRAAAWRPSLQQCLGIGVPPAPGSPGQLAGRASNVAADEVIDTIRCSPGAGPVPQPQEAHGVAAGLSLRQRAVADRRRARACGHSAYMAHQGAELKGEHESRNPVPQRCDCGWRRTYIYMLTETVPEQGCLYLEQTVPWLKLFLILWRIHYNTPKYMFVGPISCLQCKRTLKKKKGFMKVVLYICRLS